MNIEEANLWQRRFEELLNNARQRFRPLIVLWGPGSYDEIGFQKRNKIRNSIKAENPDASVILPEDPGIGFVTQKFVSDIDLQEIFQGLAADLIFALDTSQGVAEEVARYSRIPSIAKRLLVLASNSRKHGFSEIIRRKLQVEFFSEEELKVCDRASHYCTEQVRAWLIEQLANKDY